MSQRGNHYASAFAEYLRQTRTPYVLVDEQRRSLLHEASLKSMDFIVYSRQDRNLLVDVKGRQFPSGGESNPHKWENWATEDDLRSLLKWEQVFGTGFRAVLVFAYDLLDERLATEFETLFEFREHRYAFYGVWVDQYQAQMRTRSPSWETVSLPSRAFRDLRSPIREFL
jgi:hypothetical protein